VLEVGDTSLIKETPDSLVSRDHCRLLCKWSYFYASAGCGHTTTKTHFHFYRVFSQDSLVFLPFSFTIFQNHPPQSEKWHAKILNTFGVVLLQINPTKPFYDSNKGMWGGECFHRKRWNQSTRVS